MKNNIDFIYEYSDLNLFQTRAKVLTGKYKGMIIEYGKSGVARGGGKNLFDFTYTVYAYPDSLDKNTSNEDYITFFSELLTAIVIDRRTDKNAKQKLDLAAMKQNVSQIKIDDKFYSGDNKPINTQQTKLREVF
jgi:hypothetical protein